MRPLVERRIIEALTGPEAREDTIATFRRMLREGELDDREIQVDVPVKEGRTREVLILINTRKQIVCMCSKDWRSRASHSGEIALAGSCRLRSTLVAAPVLFAHAVFTLVKSKQFHSP